MEHSTVQNYLENRLIWRLHCIKSAKKQGLALKFNSKRLVNDNKYLVKLPQEKVNVLWTMTFLNYSFSKLVLSNKNNLTKILPENFETQENEFNERELEREQENPRA